MDALHPRVTVEVAATMVGSTVSTTVDSCNAIAPEEVVCSHRLGGATAEKWLPSIDENHFRSKADYRIGPKPPSDHHVSMLTGFFTHDPLSRSASIPARRPTRQEFQALAKS